MQYDVRTLRAVLGAWKVSRLVYIPLELHACIWSFRRMSKALRSWQHLLQASQAVERQLASSKTKAMLRTILAWFMLTVVCLSGNVQHANKSSLDDCRALEEIQKSPVAEADNSEMLLQSLLLSYRRLDDERFRRRVLSCWANLSGGRVSRVNS